MIGMTREQLKLMCMIDLTGGHEDFTGYDVIVESDGIEIRNKSYCRWYFKAAERRNEVSYQTLVYLMEQDILNAFEIADGRRPSGPQKPTVKVASGRFYTDGDAL